MKFLCPACPAPEVTLDEKGNVARHTRWVTTDWGPERLRSYCRAGEGKPPVKVEGP